MRLPYVEDDQFRYPDAEIVIGLVFQLGVSRETFLLELEIQLKQLGYDDVRLIKLSKAMELFEPLEVKTETGQIIKLDSTNKYDHINSHMDFGNALRRTAGRGDLLALAAINEIAQARLKVQNEPRPLKRVAHVMSSLKHPDEVHTLRRVYGSGFVLIGVHAPREARIKLLSQELADERKVRDSSAQKTDYDKCETDAEFLVVRDEREPFTYGQRMEDAFQLADLFVTFSVPDEPEQVRYEIKRFLRLLMGDVSSSRKDPDGISSTPSKKEYCMFQAYAASLRSGAMSRQVGVAIATPEGEVLTLGCNEVPKAKGGLYWEDEPGEDGREISRSEDSASKYEIEMLNDVHRVLSESNPGVVIPPVLQLKKHLENTRIMKLVEFMREAHAEMDAISSAARKGIPISGSILYCTTFPCHECAKLIVASGIAKVVYIEPYRKSRALELHSDSIEHDKLTPANGMIHFEHFVGVGPSRYADIFSISAMGRKLNRKNVDDKRILFDPAKAQLRDPLSPNSYLDREMLVSDLLIESKKKLQES